MKNASRKYKNQMQKPMRNLSHCVVTIGNTDITAITDGVWNAAQTEYSKVETLDYEHRYGNTVATLELNRWVLDGKTQVLTPNYNDGFISQKMLSEIDYYLNADNGECITDENENRFAIWNNQETAYSQKVLKRFSIPHTFTGLTLTFDTRINEFPFAINVSYYNGYFLTELETSDGEFFTTDTSEIIEALIISGSGQGLIGSATVYPTGNVCEVPLAGSNVDTIVIEFVASLPHRRPRLEHIMWGVSAIFSDTQLAKVTQSHDVDPLSRRLPQEKMNVTVFDYDHIYDPDNPRGVYSYINKGTPVSVVYGYELDDGETEWIKADNYSLQDTPSFKNERVTFNCVGLSQTLNGYYYKGVLGNKSLYSIAEDVLEDALERGYIYPTADGENPWEIDDELQDMYTDAVVPIDTFANILQLIAHASRSRFFTDDDNIIHIRPFGISPVGIFNGVFSDNGHAQHSEWQTVDYGSDIVQSMITLELNRWTLDGTGTTLIQNEGFIGNDISDDEGTSSSAWQKTFDVSHDLPVITITFDDVLNEYPLALKVEYYGADGLINTEYAYPDSTEFSINSENINDCTSIKVSTLATLPYRRNRVSKTSFRETDFSLTLDSVKQDSQATTKIEKLRDVVVNEYHYEAQATASEIYKKSITLTETTTVHIEYQLAQDINVSITGGTAVEQHVYAQAADIKLNAGTYTITITGKTLSTYSLEHRMNVNVTGDDDIEENQIITNSDMAEALMNHVSTYLQLRNTYDASYRGNPELEVGDIIELETLYSQVVYGLILTDQIDYNGALSGKVKVKGLI